MKKVAPILFLFFTLLLASSVQAVKIEFHTFENKQQEQLYFKLIEPKSG